MGILEFGLGDDNRVPGSYIGSTGCCVGLLTEKGMWTCVYMGRVRGNIVRKHRE